MENRELQLELDIKKWIESEKIGHDLCGTYAFCEYCEKEIKYPCAEAYSLALEDEEIEEEYKVAENTNDLLKEIKTSSKSLSELIIPKRKSKYKQLSFQEKLDKAKDETKEKYYKLKELIESNDYSFKMLRRFVVIRYTGLLCGKVTLVRNSLRFHMALNPKSYEKHTHYDFGHFKCYSHVPFTMKYETKKAFTSTEALLLILAKKMEKLYIKQNN